MQILIVPVLPLKNKLARASEKCEIVHVDRVNAELFFVSRCLSNPNKLLFIARADA